MEKSNRNAPGDDKDFYSSDRKRILKEEPNSSPNIQKADVSVIHASSSKLAGLLKMHPDLIRKLQSALRGREFMILDKDYNPKFISFEHDPVKFLEDNNLTIIQHDSNEQSWLKEKVKEWKNFIDSLQNKCCVIFSEEDFSKTYVCTTAADSESILSEISKFFDQGPSDIKISPYVMEFVRHNKKFSDLKLEETAQDGIWIRSIRKPRLAKLKEEIRKVICQSYLLDENQYKLLCKEKKEVLSHIEKKFQVKGTVFAADVPLVVEVNQLTSLSCIVRGKSQNAPVDNLIILSEQKPSQEYIQVFDSQYYKIWKAFPWNIPANQVVYAEMLPAFTEEKLNMLFEECLRNIYLSSLPVTVLGIQACSQITQNWKKFISCLVSTVEYLRVEQVPIPHHYIMLIVENYEVLAQIKNIFENKTTFAKEAEGKLNVKVVEGDLTEQKVDIIVNSTNPMLNLGSGAISGALMKKAGPEIQKECKRAYPQGIHDLQWALTKGYNLPCEYVLHGVLPQIYQKSAISILVSTCLEKAALCKVSSIAFPALGTGNLNYPLDVVVKEMTEGFNTFSMKYSTHSIKEVRIVVFPGQPEIIKSFSQIMTNASVGNLSSLSSSSEEKWLKDHQRKLLLWILFMNYSNEPKNLELALRNFQMDLEKVPFMIHSDDLEELFFFTNIFSLVPDIITQYSEKKDGDVQLFVPKENLMKIKDLLKDIKNKITSESLKLEVKLNNKQVEILLQKIRQKYPWVRCKFTDNGQVFSFHSLDWDMNQKAKYQLESFLGLRRRVSVTSGRFGETKPEPGKISPESVTVPSSYLEPERIRVEPVTLPSSYLEPEKIRAEPVTLPSSYLEPERIRAEPVTLPSSYLEPEKIRVEPVILPSSYLEPEKIRAEPVTLPSSYLEPEKIRVETVTVSSPYLEQKIIRAEPVTLPSSYLEPEKIRVETVTVSSPYLEQEIIRAEPIPSSYLEPEKIRAEPTTVPSPYLVQEKIRVEPVTLPSSYLEPEKIRAEPTTVPSSYLEPEKIRAEPVTLPSSYLEPEKIRAEPTTVPSSYLEPEKIRAEPTTVSSPYRVQEIIRSEPMTIPSSYFESVTVSSSYFDREIISTEPTTVPSSYLEPDKIRAEPMTIPSSYFEQERIKSFVSNSKKNEDINSFKIQDGLLVKVYHGDILNVDVDGIVDVANKWLRHGSGAATTIINAAGDAVNRALQEKLNGRILEDGEVLSTSAGNLKRYKNIIHSVGPVYSATKAMEYYRNKVAEVVYSSLTEASRLGLCSVAFPAITISGVPPDVCTNGYFMGIKEFCKRKTPDCQLKEVHFVDLIPDKCQAIKDYFAKQLNEPPMEITGNNIHQPKDNSRNIPNQRKPENMEVDPVDDQNVTCFACKKSVHQSMSQKKCKHIFCTHCIEKPCSLCHKTFDIVRGNHPIGTMHVIDRSYSRPEVSINTHVYVIQYHISSTFQEGQLFTGTTQWAFLPFTEEGTIILKMLQLAFERYLIFRVGKNERYVSWADIPHKTNLHGSLEKNGCLDPNYLNEVKARLAEKGITPEDVAGRKPQKYIILQ